MDFKKALPVVDRFLTWVSLKRVFAISITVAIVILSLTLFENRTQLANGIATRNSPERSQTDEPFKLSDQSQELIKSLVKKNREILLVTVVSVNMRVLQRTPVFFFTEDRTVLQMVNSYAENRNLSVPLFTQEEKNDAQIVSLLNGEFSCNKYEDTINGLVLPGLKGKVQTVCRVGLPPYHGSFAGYITIMTTTALTSYKEQEIRLEAVQLATTIYMTDVVGKRQ